MSGVALRAVVPALVGAIVVVLVVVPPAGGAAACDAWLRQTRQMVGAYLPVEQPYARPFVFGMLVSCNGGREVVTVQRPTGTLPVCEARQEVEVVGMLTWNKRLVDGHYEINDPSSVTCRAGAGREATEAPTPQAPEARASEARAPELRAPELRVAEPRVAEPPRALAPVPSGRPPETAPPRVAATAVGQSVWAGRYHDSRGEGDVTFTLLRGASTVSGVWKLRTGGGGPVTGLLQAEGHRMQLRMESIAPECPGTFEGSAEITDTTLVATYRGKDCQGEVTEGRLDLHVQ